MTDRFVSEKEVEEAKKRRQEEWQKIRKPTDPKGMCVVTLFVSDGLKMGIFVWRHIYRQPAEFDCCISPEITFKKVTFKSLIAGRVLQIYRCVFPSPNFI